MDDIWARIADNLIDRVSGPMKFRLLMQPIMASIFAIIVAFLLAIVPYLILRGLVNRIARK